MPSPAYLDANASGAWVASTAVTAGDRVYLPARTGTLIFECTTSGTTGAFQPTWPTVVDGFVADGSARWDARNFDGWDNAAAYLQNALDSAGAGGIVYVAYNHTENLDDISNTITFPGTSGDNPIQIIRVNDTTTEPPQVYDPVNAEGTLTGACFTVTAGNIDIGAVTNDSGVIFYGCGFQNEVSTGDIRVRIGEHGMVSFVDCWFDLGGSNGAQDFIVGVDNDWTSIAFIRCHFEFSHSSQGIEFRANCPTVFRDCLVRSGSTANQLISTIRAGASITVDGIDASNLSSGARFANLSSISPTHFNVAGVAMPTSAPDFHNGTLRHLGQNFERQSYSIATAAEQFKYVNESMASVVTEDVNVRRLATYDGTNGYSLNFAASTDAVPGAVAPAVARVLIAEQWADADATVTVHAISDDAITFTQHNFWIEVEHPDPTEGFLIVTDDSTRDVDWFLTTSPTAVTNTDGTEPTDGWTGSGLPGTVAADRVHYKPSVTLDSKAGIIRVFVCFAHATQELWVDPFVEIT